MQIGIRKIYGQNDDLQYTMCDVSDCVSFACLQLNIHNRNQTNVGKLTLARIEIFFCSVSLSLSTFQTISVSIIPQFLRKQTPN